MKDFSRVKIIHLFSYRSTAPVNGFQKVSNSYQANPYFRPKVVTNQVQPSTTTNNANLPPPPPSRDSSIATTNVTLQTLTSGSTTITTRGRPSITLRPPNPPIPSNGRTQESETTVEPSSAQEDNRRWAHNVASAPIVRRMTTSDERPSITSKLSETNVSDSIAELPFRKSFIEKIPNSISNDLMKPKGASATDIVISLMDTWVKSKLSFRYHQTQSFRSSVHQSILQDHRLSIYLLVPV